MYLMPLNYPLQKGQSGTFHFVFMLQLKKKNQIATSKYSNQEISKKLFNTSVAKREKQARNLG